MTPDPQTARPPRLSGEVVWYSSSRCLAGASRR